MIKPQSDSSYVTVASPGRINLIGEHVDYNDGFVLPTAIDKKIYLKLKKNNSDDECSIYSETIDESLKVSLNNFTKSNLLWENYILGILHELLQVTNKLRGFDCIIESHLPMGSGISSSAALMCGLTFGLNELFEIGLDRIGMVKLAHRAEHDYVGTQCGIMDQFASIMSKKGNVILLDCDSLEHQYIPIAFGSYSLLLLNSNVSHNLASSEYNVRREECRQGLSAVRNLYPKVKSLRFVTISMLNECEKIMPVKVYKRCQYVIEEILRVGRASEALKKGNLHELGRLFYETHDGLSSLYEVSCQELDFLVDFTKENNAILGARMMGGGFGGCSLNIVHKDYKNQFVQEISDAYASKFNRKLSLIDVVPDDGTVVDTL